MKKQGEPKLTKRAAAIGTLLCSINLLEKTPSGRRKLQEILGSKVFCESTKGQWYYNLKILRTFTVAKLHDLADNVTKAELKARKPRKSREEY